MRIISNLVILSLLFISSPALAQYRHDRPDFYDEGQRQIEREIERLNQESNEDILTVEGQGEQWQEFAHPPGGFRVLMPVTPEEQSEVIETPAATLEFQEFVADFKSAQFIVAYADYSPKESTSAPANILALVRQEILNSALEVGYKLTEERAISLSGTEFGNHPGTELTMKYENQIVTFRLYSLPERFYLLGTNNIEATGLSATDISKFFDSFQLVP
ncbi:MAG TPA: hypothetical protein IGS52_21570 [Oscillatoriaceae cyanobacterium M33_DOE_052]|uniref:DUF1795 domain-containing protein n=1 Tax=Planktothricoides sp. SpSt-374 TaxID=2282167 RepID=A0A7C3ZL37_9CYAN|nr:hypothetical protein [Oscillatoriaceae cyanobacterium M33_DOE_052]